MTALCSGVDDADGDVGVRLLADGGAAVHLRVAETVGEREVVVADVGVVVDEVLGEHLLVAAVLLRHLAGGGHLDVHVVGRAAEDAVVGVGDDLEGAAAAQQVLLVVGDDEGEADRVAGGGRGEGHVVVKGRVVLEVEEVGESAGHAAELGVGGDVRDELALEPDLAGVPEAVQELLRPVRMPM